MKIDLTKIDSENFMVHSHYVGEHLVWLVQPIHIGAHWTKDTLHFRSSVWDSEGNLISASFRKFFNWDEQPDVTPLPKSLAGARLMEKLDGSTLIFSRYKGVTIARTRGTVDAHKQENGYEVDVLLDMYPKFKNFLESMETSPHSYIFEWLSPTNRIVINYGDIVDMKLIGMICNHDYFLQPQDMLDLVAKDFDLKRPESYSYDSIEEMKTSVEAFKGKEGLCVYYNDGQDIRKVKGAEYLAKHRMKSELSSIDKVIDLWFIAGRLDYQEFFDYCEKSFDFEVATDARGFISKICDAWKQVKVIEAAMHEKVKSLQGMSRKDQAVIVLQAYGNTNRASFVFQLLDGKTWNDDAYKKLLYQCL